MQLEVRAHFEHIVEPQWQAYQEAERLLSEAVASTDAKEVEIATYATLRAAANACWHTHHFADLAFSRKMGRAAKRGEIHEYILDVQARHCIDTKTKAPTADMTLLGDVADALKHAILSRKSLVSNADQVLVVGRGFGTGGYGTGKYGGTLQVWIKLGDSRRSLLSVLKNVVSAWTAVIETDFPEA